jgi:hypothetical protein
VVELLFSMAGTACMVFVQVEGADEELTDADLRPEALDQQRVEQLLAEHLPENNVAIITRNEFTEALRDFVDKVMPPPGHTSYQSIQQNLRKYAV